MKQLTLNVEDALYFTAEQEALRAGSSLSSLLMDLIRRVAGSGGTGEPQSDFEKLATQETELWAKLDAGGASIAPFSAADRLSRDEVHQRS